MSFYANFNYLDFVWKMLLHFFTKSSTYSYSRRWYCFARGLLWISNVNLQRYWKSTGRYLSLCTSIVSNKRITIWKEDMHICISGDKEKDKKKQNGEEAWPGYIYGAWTSLKTIMANNWHINLFFINYDGEPKTITRHVK